MFFYPFGCATGNAIGILVERKPAFGLVVLRVSIQNADHAIARALREKEQPGHLP